MNGHGHSRSCFPNQTSAHCLQAHFVALIRVSETKYFHGSYLINPATREMSV